MIVNPGQSITEAIRSSTDDTVAVRGGEYHEQIKVSRPVNLIAHEGEPVVVDGRYQLPTGIFERVDPKDSSRGFVYGGLLQVIGVDDVHVRGITLVRSRGRGVSFSGTRDKNIKNVSLTNIRVLGARNAGVRVNFYDGAVIEGVTVRDAGNYVPYPRQSPNWPVILSIGRGTNGRIVNCTVSESWGEGIGTGGGVGVEVIGNTVYDCFALLMYLHHSQDMVVTDNLLYNTNNPDFLRGLNPSWGAVLNNEYGDVQWINEQPPLKNAEFARNIVAGCVNNLVVWPGAGKMWDGKQAVKGVLTGANIHHNTFANAVSNWQEGQKGDSPKTAVSVEVANIDFEDCLFDGNAILGSTQETSQIPAGLMGDNYISARPLAVPLVAGQVTREMFRPLASSAWAGYGALAEVVVEEPPIPEPTIEWRGLLNAKEQERIAMIQVNDWGQDSQYFNERLLQKLITMLDGYRGIK